MTSNLSNSSSSSPAERRSSSEIIGGNEDLLIELLVKLSPISVLRFQAVNKQWQSIISSPSFPHYYKSSQTPSFILVQTTSSSYSNNAFIYFSPATKLYFPMSFNPSPSVTNLKVLQSKQGLLLIEGIHNFTKCRDFYVYNPMTGKYRNLFLKDSDHDDLIVGFSLFDWSSSPTASSHYKVDCLRMKGTKCSYELYDSQTHTWNHVLSFDLPLQFLCLFFHCSVSTAAIHFNKRIYCITPTTWPVLDWAGPIPTRTPKIQTFCLDLDKATFSTPKSLRPWGDTDSPGGTYKTYIMESNGHLYCVCMYLASKTKTLLRVFEMSDDNTEWVKKYSADLSSNVTFMDRAKVVGISRGECDEDCLVWIRARGKMISYRFSDKKFDVIELRSEFGLIYSSSQFNGSFATV